MGVIGTPRGLEGFPQQDSSVLVLQVMQFLCFLQCNLDHTGLEESEHLCWKNFKYLYSYSKYEPESCCKNIPQCQWDNIWFTKLSWIPEQRKMQELLAAFNSLSFTPKLPIQFRNRLLLSQFLHNKSSLQSDQYMTLVPLQSALQIVPDAWSMPVFKPSPLCC